jgi:hypothetical protein
MAKSAPPERVVNAVEWAAGQLDADTLVDVRLSVCARLPGGRTAQVDWLVKTIDLWINRAENPHYVLVLPGTLLALPTEITFALLEHDYHPDDRSLHACWAWRLAR